MIVDIITHIIELAAIGFLFYKVYAGKPNKVNVQIMKQTLPKDFNVKATPIPPPEPIKKREVREFRRSSYDQPKNV